MTPKVPRTKIGILRVLRELAEDMDASVEWHYADVVEHLAGNLNLAMAGLRLHLGDDDLPDDFVLLERDYSATRKTVGQPAFDRLRRAVRSATAVAEALETIEASRSLLSGGGGQFHPDIGRVSGRLLANAHAGQAIFEAFKAVNNRVKDMSDLDEFDGKALMAKAFSEQEPVLRLNEARNRSDRDEQEGFKLIFMGAMLGIRNPKAHESVEDVDGDRAAEYLALASLLMRRLDDAAALLPPH